MVTINFYDNFYEYIGDGTMDMDNITNTFFIILLNSSHTFTAANDDLAAVTANQLATNFGYTQATGGGTGKALTSITWQQDSPSVATWAAATVTWNASGGSIGAADDAVIFYDPSTTDKLVCSIDFNGSQTAGDGTNFVITWNASGIFTLS